MNLFLYVCTRESVPVYVSVSVSNKELCYVFIKQHRKDYKQVGLGNSL